MGIQDKIEDLEQQIFIACSEGNFDQMYLLENELEQLRRRIAYGMEEDPYALSGSFLTDD
ncbi:hypothetical protein HC752_17360 [Vibrio sp. S9_S30]|uniref:hypothetical protein n=1 Tax=Vibrio sp. S9_S30 TaxID=2720226 RepID=UPI00168150E4|nr:hypothetical protein [Vibrio sp. S9_S30]MBD1558702.1 hypothetical protein [Vibrio sp. S9_S30]